MLTPEKVANAPDPSYAFAQYVQQVLGVPWPTLGDQVILKKKTNEFFGRYPHADYYTLCRVVTWIRGQKRTKRFTRVWLVIDSFRDAYAAGVIPELDRERSDDHIEARIKEILAIEKDPVWRTRLIGTQGLEYRRKLYFDWVSTHASF